MKKRESNKQATKSQPTKKQANKSYKKHPKNFNKRKTQKQ